MNKVFPYGLCLVFFLNTFTGISQPAINHWESIVKAADTWKYFPDKSEPDSDWYELFFNDSSWSAGVGGFGYGDGDDGTVIDTVLSVYLRKVFTVYDTSAIERVLLHVDYDDAFVAWLNGIEIARANIGNVGDHPAFNQLAYSGHEALLYQGQTPDSFPVSKNLLVPGENILAIQVNNNDPASSDLSSNVWFSAGIRDTSFNYQPIPGWFKPFPSKFSSNLPVVLIDTHGQTILDESRIIIGLKVIYNGPGKINSPEDTAGNYNGLANIEIRGESSQMFPKKSYSFELQDSLGQSRNVSLMGLPKENDWILHAHYSDKTMLRNEITYKMSRDIGRYATRTRYCEVFLNGDYIGVYSLMEKIKQDKNRVDIAKLNTGDISGDALTGGYILRVDKVDPNDYPPWVSVPDPQLSGVQTISFQYSDPNGWKLQPEQQQYIRNFIFSFESALSSNRYLDPAAGYARFIDLGSFIDFLLINEICKNVDAYLFSTYLYKERDSKGAKLSMGPVWDFDLGYANVDYYMNVVNIPGWIYDDDWRMYWWRRMMTDSQFRNELSCRWHSLRTDALRDEKIFGYIDSVALAIEEPRKRNFERWPIIGLYIWPNYFVGQTYEQEVFYLKNWLNNRLTWMDNNISGCDVTGINGDAQKNFNFTVYPNPFEDKIIFSLNSTVKGNFKVRIFNITGQVIKEWNLNLNPGNPASIEWDGNDKLLHLVRPGIYLVTLESAEGGIMNTFKVLKK